MFLITGVPYKRKMNYFLDKDWRMKISSLYPEVPYRRLRYKRTLLCYPSSLKIKRNYTIMNSKVRL